MKLSKKTITVLSFTLGASVFLSTAFADMALGSGYDRLKSSAKHTAAQMEKGLSNYTIEAMFTVTDNNRTLLQASTLNKIDMAKMASEKSTSTQYSNGETSTEYSYSDQQLSVWKNGREDKYYVTEFDDSFEKDQRSKFKSPFNEKGAPEVEKIVDALVGNLKDYIQVEERAEGGKRFAGSLSEAQVPAVVNAVSSFGIKQMIADQSRMEKNSQLPEMESDIFVKKVSGTAVESKAGLLENVTGDVVLSGKDKNGARHDLTLNVVFKLSGIGSTKVTKPDLTGADVEKVSQPGGFSSKYEGTYKNNIVIEKNGKFVKIGERTLTITRVEKDKVAGAYSETVKPGFEAEYPDKYSFSFEYNPNSSKSMPTFTYTDPKGEQEIGRIHPSGSGKMYLDLGIKMLDENSYSSNHDRRVFDGEFNRAFEE